MNRGFDIPKASPESVARAIFDGVEKGEQEIFPDPMSASMAESWRSSAAKALERRMRRSYKQSPSRHEQRERASGVMSVTWMAVIAVFVLARSSCRREPRSTCAGAGDRRLGLVIVFAPSSVPGLTPPM